MDFFQKRAGFTLIELSIVLVVIGLVIGGVLVGGDLIRAAQVRAQVAQIEKLFSAVKAFQLKYNCLPGDCAEASNIDLGVDGDGNGVIELTNHLVNFDAPEMEQFWVHLGNSKLIEGNFTAGSVPGVNSMPLKLTGMGLAGNRTGGMWLFPVILFRNSGTHWFGENAPIAAHSIILTTTSAQNVTAGVYLPLTAYAIDVKIDDGYPFKGVIGATDSVLGVSCVSGNCGILTFGSAFDDPTACVDDNLNPAKYNVRSVTATNYSLCTLIINKGI